MVPLLPAKGTVAAIVAQRLGFHYLDSGSLYRLLALHARKLGVNWDDETALAGLAAGLPAAFEQGVVLLDGNDVSAEIRAEEMASVLPKWLRSPLYVPPCCSASVIWRGPGLVTTVVTWVGGVSASGKDFSDRQRRRARNAPL
jgi:hypothetical protein